MTAVRHAAALIVVASAIGCGAQNSRAVFERDVVPVLESTCAASTCHGVAPGAEDRGEVIDRTQLFFDLDAVGRLADLDAAYLTAKDTIDTSAAPAFSSLLRKPLAEGWGGLPHRGGDNFVSLNDDKLAAVAAWIELEEGGGEVPAPLTDLERSFAEEVQPLLFGMTCAASSCHGLQAAIPYRLDSGIGGEVSDGVSRANYQQSRAMLALGGDPLQSRLLRKSLPLHDGGIVHKGGNSSFLAGLDDPRLAPIAEWACLERLAATGQDCLAEGDASAQGLVFVRGPLAPGEPFDLDRFAPGSDLFYVPLSGPELTPGEPVNLTAGLHDAPADIRDPAVDASGRRVAFAMRTSADEGHSLWEIDLDTGAGARLTDAPGMLPGGGLATDRDPTWAPDGSLWFVSTRGGTLADAGRFEDPDLYELDVASGDVRRRTWTPHAERAPTFLSVGKVAGEVVFSTLRDAVGGQEGGHLFRFPPDLHVEYHVHFGISAPEDLFLNARELPDGRYLATLGDLGGVWDAGRLGVIDRNFGPEIGADQPAASALPFYAPPLARLDPTARSVGSTPILYREATALPDGRLVAATAAGPVDLGDPDAPFDLRIELLTLVEAPDGSGAVLQDRRVLIDAPGLHDHDPQPVFVGWAGPAYNRIELPAGETGRFLHNGLPMNDAILESLEPAGPKPLDGERFERVRLVEALSLTPAQRLPVPPDETRDGHEGATSTGIGSHPPARVLADLPLASDGTFGFDLPSGVPFRVQGLDARGLASGAPHNRWYDVSPGQVIKQGVGHTNPRFYAAQCSACHGGLDGDPASVFVAPDVMTTATVTLSRFEGADPRRPISLPLAGDETRMEVDFQRDVQPILASCSAAGCHSAADLAGGLSLTEDPTTWYSDAYESLLAPGDRSGGGFQWVDAATPSALQSHLVEWLRGEELEAAGEILEPGSPHGALSDSEIATIQAWIELGATWVGTLEDPP